MVFVVMVTGAKRSGKDTFCDALEQICNEENIITQRHAFANPLKQIAASALGIDIATLDRLKNNDSTLAVITQGGPVNLVTVRQFLQQLGTEGIRETLGQDTWTRLCLEKITGSLADIFIVSDFRFLNEYSTIATQVPPGIQVVTVRIERSVANDDTHASETELAQANFVFDYYIPNDNSIADLHKSVRRFLWYLRTFWK